MAQAEVAAAQDVPRGKDNGGDGAQFGNLIKPDNTGIVRQMGGAFVVPSDLCGDATLWRKLSETAVNKERAGRFEEFENVVEGGICGAGEPVAFEFADEGIGEWHGDHIGDSPLVFSTLHTTVEVGIKKDRECVKTHANDISPSGDGRMGLTKKKVVWDARLIG